MSLNYKKQNLFINNISIKSVAKIIQRHFIYSYEKIRNNFENFSNYFKKVNPLTVFFSQIKFKCINNI